VGEDTLVFVVRIWVERREIPSAPLHWRGSIEDVPSGERRYLMTVNELTSFVEERLRRLLVVERPPAAGSASAATDEEEQP
jgi:hypothetical protein